MKQIPPRHITGRYLDNEIDVQMPLTGRKFLLIMEQGRHFANRSFFQLFPGRWRQITAVQRTGINSHILFVIFVTNELQC